MKNRLLLLSAAVMLLTFFSCSRQEPSITENNDQLSQDVLSRIAAMGFSTEGAYAQDGGYIVENDIFLSAEELGQISQVKTLITGNREQYRTTNLVTGLPRVITISMASQLPTSYSAAVDAMIARYNAQNLQLTFQRVASNGNIQLVRGNGQYLASAGFPTSTGAPYNQVKINSQAIGTGTTTTFTNYVATIMAHEVGHCIGFRHTDYMDRSYSCGGATSNEGASTVGAINIPGTPTTADPGSWMLACIGANQNRPFNNNDITALNFLY